MIPFPAPLKDALRPLYWGLLRRPEFRRWRTSNYRSGKVALGEQNHYALARDWITVDIAGADFNVELDARTVLPFADDSQSIIYSSHMIEHLDEATLARVLSECRRILKPGGRIRLETPDAERILELYRSNDRAFIEHFAAENRKGLVEELGMASIYGEEHIGVLGLLSCYVADGHHVPAIASKAEFDAAVNTGEIEEIARWCVELQTPAQRATHGHVNVLYFEKLRRLLAQAGFRDIARSANRSTNIPGLAIAEIERAERSLYSFYVEAAK